MLTDYKNIVFILLPIYLAFYILVDKCSLHPKTASLLLFILFTLPAIAILVTILYYHFNKETNDKTKDDCVKYNNSYYGEIVCNVWDDDKKKCYKGLYNNDTNKCDTNLIKNMPMSVYVGSLLIIAANIFFHNLESKCL